VDLVITLPENWIRSMEGRYRLMEDADGSKNGLLRDMKRKLRLMEALHWGMEGEARPMEDSYRGMEDAHRPMEGPHRRRFLSSIWLFELF
jgi:hypothetical protein